MDSNYLYNLQIFTIALIFFVSGMELVGGKWLTISGVCYYMPVSLAYMLTAGIAYLVKGWRHLQLVITLPSIVIFIICWYVYDHFKITVTHFKCKSIIHS